MIPYDLFGAVSLFTKFLFLRFQTVTETTKPRYFKILLCFGVIYVDALVGAQRPTTFLPASCFMVYKTEADNCFIILFRDRLHLTLNSFKKRFLFLFRLRRKRLFISCSRTQYEGHEQITRTNVNKLQKNNVKTATNSNNYEAFEGKERNQYRAS